LAEKDEKLDGTTLQQKTMESCGQHRPKDLWLRDKGREKIAFSTNLVKPADGKRGLECGENRADVQRREGEYHSRGIIGTGNFERQVSPKKVTQIKEKTPPRGIFRGFGHTLERKSRTGLQDEKARKTFFRVSHTHRGNLEGCKRGKRGKRGSVIR